MREGPGWHLVLVLQVEAGIGEGDSMVGLQLELGRRGCWDSQIVSCPIVKEVESLRAWVGNRWEMGTEADTVTQYRYSGTHL